MSTSAEPSSAGSSFCAGSSSSAASCTAAAPSSAGFLAAEGGRTGSAGVRVRALPYDHPVAQYLVEQVQQEYVMRYGGRDAAAVDAAEFLPPQGVFLVAEVEGVPAACGAWRVYPPGGVEIKRVYVEPDYRRRGLARLVMEALESSAARAGHRCVVLNTGDRQPEALALYERLGYRPVPGYGVYACAPGAVFLGKELLAPGSSEQDAPEDEGRSRSWVS